MPDPLSSSAAASVSGAPAGRHVLAEFNGIDPALLDDEAALRAALTQALVTAGAQVRHIVAETFVPQGVTVLALLAQSHASIHTWPEHGSAQADVFTCGETADPVRAVELLSTALGAKDLQWQVVDRGPQRHAVTETLGAGLTRHWALGQVHHEAVTRYQRVLIAETAHGTTLFCDSERQSAADTQLVYHEALFVPAAVLAAHRERVLVIGCSEGVVSQLALAAGAQLVDHVDIDRDCVRACAAYLPYGYTPTELAAAERHEGQLRVHYRDGEEFVRTANQRYDIVVLDLPDERPADPTAQLNRLYTASFVSHCAELLTDGGVVVCQSGSPALWRNATLRAGWDRFTAVFAQVVAYVSDEHEWAFLIGRRTASPDPTEEMIIRLARFSPTPTSIDAAALRARSLAPFQLRHR